VRALIAVAIAAAVMVGSGSSTAHAGPTQDLATARNEFRAGKHKDAILLLNNLLYPDVKLADEDDLYEAHLLFGVCLFETGDNKGATREIEQALFINGNQPLDPSLFSAESVRFFNEVKAAKEARDKAAADARAAAEERERLRKAIENLRVVESRPWWVNVMPFGAGQFQNGHYKKGVAFAATQGVAAATSVTIFLYLVNKYGYGGQVPREEAADVRQLQQVAIGADLVFYGAFLWSIVDGFWNYRANVVLDKSSIPDDLLAPPGQKTKPKPASKTSWNLTPIVVPDGAGIGITWSTD
jgi:hypothetical protein